MKKNTISILMNSSREPSTRLAIPVFVFSMEAATLYSPAAEFTVGFAASFSLIWDRSSCWEKAALARPRCRAGPKAAPAFLHGFSKEKKNGDLWQNDCRLSFYIFLSYICKKWKIFRVQVRGVERCRKLRQRRFNDSKSFFASTGMYNK